MKQPDDSELTRPQMEGLCAVLPKEIREELLAHARVPRSTAMRALCVENDNTWKKIVDATPELTHKLPGEQKVKYRSVVIVRLLADSRCAAQGEGAKR